MQGWIRHNLYFFGLIAVLLIGQFVSPDRAHADKLLKRPREWAQTYTGRAPDQAVRFGKLPNGVRYAIMKNERPQNAVSMRFRIGSGSLQERDDELGVAHILEHMAFRGSKNIADGEAVKSLERLGLRFGADTNAGTDWDETVYKFDFPNADADSLTTGLKLFREIGNRLLLKPETLDAERGVILSEERERDNPALAVTRAELNFVMPGMLVPARFPIGTRESIQATTVAKLRRFYDANYRPDNATIVIIGAVDVDAIEAQIKEVFSDWTASGSADNPDLGHLAPRQLESKIYTAPGAPDVTGVNWLRPFNDEADTEDHERNYIIKNLGMNILNRRLRERAQGADAPFILAVAQSHPIAGSAEVTGLAIIAKPDHLADALKTAVVEQRRIVQDGVSNEELKSAKEQFHSAYQRAADGMPTRLNSTIADSLVATDNAGNLFTSPAQDLANYDRRVSDLQVEAVNAGLRAAFSGSGPLILRSTPKASSITQAEIEATVNAALTAPLPKYVDAVVRPWPYTYFGRPGRVIMRRFNPALNLTLVKFANGTTLGIRPNHYAKNSILVKVALGNGRLGVSNSEANSLWAADAFLDGGTKQRTLNEIERELHDKVVSIKFETSDAMFALTGATRREDTRLQMQLMAAFANDPGYRQEGVERLKALFLGQAQLFESLPNFVFGRTASLILHNGDRRWMLIPEQSEIENTSINDVRSLVEKATSGPKLIAVAGDVDVQRVILAVASTFGALPAAKPLPPINRAGVSISAQKAEPIILHHSGRKDQAILAQYWPMPDYNSEPRDSDAMDLASAMIRTRLLETARTKYGISYTPQTVSEQSTELDGYGYFGTVNETTPENMPKFIALTREAIDELVVDHAPKASSEAERDEVTKLNDRFDRAQRPLVESRAKALQTNEYWLGRVTEILRNRRGVNRVANYVSDISNVDLPEVKRVVRKYLYQKTPLTIEVIPKDN